MGCRVMQRPFIVFVGFVHKKGRPVDGPPFVREFCLPAGRCQREFDLSSLVVIRVCIVSSFRGNPVAGRLCSRCCHCR